MDLTTAIVSAVATQQCAKSVLRVHCINTLITTIQKFDKALEPKWPHDNTHVEVVQPSCSSALAIAHPATHIACSLLTIHTTLFCSGLRSSHYISTRPPCFLLKPLVPGFRGAPTGEWRTQWSIFVDPIPVALLSRPPMGLDVGRGVGLCHFTC